jgi:rod shape determining protein RodA
MLGSKRHQFDALLIILYLNLVIIGLLMIYSTSQQADSSPDLFNLSTPFGRQLLFAGISVVSLLFILTISAEFWKTFSLPIYLLSLVALVLVLFLGSDIKGARAWFSLGPFSFQPAEFAKLGTLLLTASFLTHFRTDMARTRSQGIAALILAVPVFLIMLQPDAGSALVFVAMLLPMYRAGLQGGFFILAGLAGLSLLLPLVFPLHLVLFGILFVALAVLVLRFDKKLIWSAALLLLAISAWVGFQEGFPEIIAGICGGFFVLFALLTWRQGQRGLVGFVLILMGLCSSLAYSAFFAFHQILMPHQRERINVWLNPSECDPRGPLYNVLQSKLAIASGGLEGKGFMDGNITRLNYVPEQTTDFIFCAIGEEHGFFGTFGVILLFTLLVLRILQIGERQRNDFSRYFAYGLAGIFFLHFSINIGMTIGLAPVIGIPLPFISYGGSSLLFFTILLAILLKLDYAYR